MTHCMLCDRPVSLGDTGSFEPMDDGDVCCRACYDREAEAASDRRVEARLERGGFLDVETAEATYAQSLIDAGRGHLLRDGQ